MFVSRRPGVSAALVVLLLAGSLSFAAPAGAAPERPAFCGAVVMDVLFVFDTTGSMGGVLASAKSGASSIMANVAAQVGDVRFGVANYRDYPAAYAYPGYATTYGSSGDYPWQLNQGLTTDQAAVSGAISGLAIGNGADWPESLTRAMHESRLQPWRADAVRMVVLFADAPPHDMDFNGQNYGGDPGPDGVVSADDLDFEATASALAAAGVRVVVVDSGGGGAAAHFNHLAATTGGAYALLGGDFVAQVTGLILEGIPEMLTRAQSVGVRAETAVPANPYVAVAPVSAAGGEHDAVLVSQTYLAAPVNGEVRMGEGSAQTDSGTTLYAGARTNLAHVSLLGGRIVAEGVEVAVRAESLDTGGEAHVVRSRIAQLWVDGAPVLTDVPPNTVVPIPGAGALILRETHVLHHGEHGAEVLVNALHLVADTDAGRLDVVVGSAYALTSCGALASTLLDTHDRDGGAGDAADEPANATVRATPALLHGRILENERIDAYAVHAKPGEKIVALLVPSTRVGALVTTLTPAPLLLAPDLDLALLEPGTFARREYGALPLSVPERVELNVDVEGDWVVRVERADATYGNYTLALLVTPIAPEPPAGDALSGADAPDACADALPLADGLHAGTLRGDDHRDFYKVHASIGDLASFVLKPTEDADGADFDLYVHDAACNPYAASALGKDFGGGGIFPKGTPDAVAMAPSLVTQTWHVEVRRHNGIGNYHLLVDVTDPQPTLAPLDAEPAGDASDDTASAAPFPAPGVRQGRALDGDDVDYYSFSADAGDRILVTLHGGAASDWTLDLLRPDGTLARTSAAPLSPSQALLHEADAAGAWYVVVRSGEGGGDYLLGVATT